MSTITETRARCASRTLELREQQGEIMAGSTPFRDPVTGQDREERRGREQTAFKVAKRRR